MEAMETTRPAGQRRRSDKQDAAQLMGQMITRAIEQTLAKAEDPLSCQEIADEVRDVCKDQHLVCVFINKLVTAGKIYRLGFGARSKFWPNGKTLVIFLGKAHYFRSLKRGKA